MKQQLAARITRLLASEESRLGTDAFKNGSSTVKSIKIYTVFLIRIRFIWDPDLGYSYLGYSYLSVADPDTGLPIPKFW